MGMKGVWAVPVIFGILFIGSLGLTPDVYPDHFTNGVDNKIVWINPADKVGKIAPRNSCHDESCLLVFRIPQDLRDSSYVPQVGDAVSYEIDPEKSRHATDVRKAPPGGGL